MSATEPIPADTPKPVAPEVKAHEVFIDVLRSYSTAPVIMAALIARHLKAAGVELRLIDQGDQ